MAFSTIGFTFCDANRTVRRPLSRQRFRTIDLQPSLIGTHRLPNRQTIFLNAVAFGIVAPLLYFMIALPDVKWIALLLVVDSLGRICGQPFAKWLKSGTAETLNVVGYVLLATVGFLRLPQSQAFALIYVSRFIGAFASANFPVVRLIMPGSKGISIAQIGFAIGCEITACIGNYHFLPGSILVTGGLMIPAIVAAVLSAASAALAFMTPIGAGPNGLANSEPMRDNAAWPSGPSLNRVLDFNTCFAAGVLLACELAYGMIFCVLPLTTREICAFSPLITAIYFAIFAWLSVGVTQLARHFSTIALMAGIILSAIGFAGISFALKLSWSQTDVHAQLHGTIAVWIAGAIGAMGHGLLRASLPSVRKTIPINTDWISPIIAAVGAVTISRLWVDHERSAFAIPAAIIMTALFAAMVMQFIPTKKPEGCTALTDTPSPI